LTADVPAAGAAHHEDHRRESGQLHLGGAGPEVDVIAEDRG